jgi:SAM-dependent methyltransferase
MHDRDRPDPEPLLTEYLGCFTGASEERPILDLACGDGRNGLFLAAKGFPVVLADRSEEALEKARNLAEREGVTGRFWQVDLEREGVNPLEEEAYAGMIVFRYLHRPLIPCIRKALAGGGLLIYETYTVDQPRFGKPRNPAFLLRPGELRNWFGDWNILHAFEGIRNDPPRAVAQIVCRRP